MILTRQDLSDAENVHECAEEFRRARDFGTDDLLSCWARKWVEAIVEGLRNPVEDLSDDLTAAEKEAQSWETQCD